MCCQCLGEPTHSLYGNSDVAQTARCGVRTSRVKPLPKYVHHLHTRHAYAQVVVGGEHGKDSEILCHHAAKTGEGTLAVACAHRRTNHREVDVLAVHVMHARHSGLACHGCRP